MRHILFLSRGGIGGSQMQLAHILANLSGRGYVPVVVCRQDGEFVEKLRGAGVLTYVVPLRPWRTWPAAFGRYGDVRRLVRIGRGHDVALVHSSDLWLSGYLNCLARKLHVPSVLHVRAPLKPAELRKHRCGAPDAVIAISHRVKDHLLLAGIPDERITVIYDAVDVERFHPDRRADNALRRDFPRCGDVLIGIVGRVAPLKRQLKFLRIADTIVRRTARSVTFFLIGEIRDHEYHARAVEFAKGSQLNGQAIFTGIRHDMPDVFGALDILVTLSGGSVMIEAMASGTPVVSAGFSTPQRSFIVQDGRNGLLMASDDTDDVADALTRLIDAPELRQRMGRHARQWATEQFSHLQLQRKTYDLYDRLVKE